MYFFFNKKTYRQTYKCTVLCFIFNLVQISSNSIFSSTLKRTYLHLSSDPKNKTLNYFPRCRNKEKVEVKVKVQFFVFECNFSIMANSRWISVLRLQIERDLSVKKKIYFKNRKFIKKAFCDQNLPLVKWWINLNSQKRLFSKGKLCSVTNEWKHNLLTLDFYSSFHWILFTDERWRLTPGFTDSDKTFDF